MKKNIILPFLLFCIFITCACGSASNDGPEVTVNKESSIADTSVADNIKNTPTEEEVVQPTTTPENLITVEEQVILDRDGVVITLKSLSDDSIWGPSLDVLVENNSERSITVQIRNLAINGVMVESIFSCDVATGKKANDEITFMSTDLEIAGIETIRDIEFNFHVFDLETWDTIFDSEVVNITTSADPSFEQAYDDSGFVALDNDGIKVVVKKLDSDDSFWGADIYVYIENNGNSDVTIQLRDVSVNGFMIEPIFSCDILSGKKAFDTITFMESDLTDNDIENISELEFSFHIFDMDSWNTIYDSEIITVTFDQ